jgi:diazepam-binding inhibitor (GABA receptor modulating acyl-CoA-binding protein)
MDSYPLAKHFDEVAKKIKEVGKGQSLSNDDLLLMYGLYKQATAGDNTTSQPWAVQLEARAKWDAWTAHKGKSADQAKQEYVQHCLKFFSDDEKKNYQ